MSDEPTTRQRELLDFMSDFQRENGCPPTVREMVSHMGGQSPNGIVGHLISLEKKGYVRHARPGRSRGWALVKVDETLICPHCGGELEP